MNRDDYIARLETLLISFPVSEREDAIEYVREFFDEADNDQDAISRLGNPEEYAKGLKEQLKDLLPPDLPPDAPDQKTETQAAWNEQPNDSHLDHPKPNGWKWALLIVLSPFILVGICVLLVLILCLFIVVFCIILALVAMILAGVIAILALLVKTVMLLGSDRLGACFDIGLILICYAMVVAAGTGLKAFWTRCLPPVLDWVKKGWLMLKGRLERGLA